VVTELAGSVASTGAWLNGSSVVVTASSADGTTTEGKGRIEPGARGALVRVPAPAGAGPYRVDVRVTSGREELSERMDVASRPPGDALLGTPMLYRATPAATSPLRPVADMQYRRTERAHLEWFLPGQIDDRSARLLGKNGLPLAVPVASSWLFVSPPASCRRASLPFEHPRASRTLRADSNDKPFVARPPTTDHRPTSARRGSR